MITGTLKNKIDAIWQDFYNENMAQTSDIVNQLTKCERKAPKFIYGDISSLKNNDSISLFFIVLYF